MKISELKKEARTKLYGKWGLAVGIGIVYTIFNLLTSILLGMLTSSLSEDFSSIISLVFNILLLPFSYGLLVSMVKLSRSENVGLIDFFTTGLRNFAKVLKLNLVMVLKMWLPILLIIISILLLGVAIYQVSASTINDATLAESAISSIGNSSTLLIIAAVALELIAMVMMTIKTLSFSLSSYLLYDNPETTCSEIINTSVRLMKGYKAKLVLLGLSFFGWIFLLMIAFVLSAFANIILAVLVLLAGTFILEPYMSFSTICFYENLKNNADESTPIVE